MDNIDVNSFDPCGLEEATTYYWRIDEVNGPNTVKGNVWSFTTRPPLGSNLIAWWKLDEGDGLTAFDSVGNNDGILINGPVWTDSGINGCLEFDGIDDHVSVPYDDSFQLPVFTVSAWVYLGRDPRSQGSGMIVGRGEDPVSDEEALLFVVSPEGSQWGEGLKIGYEDSSDREQYFGTSYFPPVASWTHVAATRGSDGQVCVYADGILLNSWQSSAVPTPDCYQDLTIGSYWGNPPSGPRMGAFFEGMIDDVRIYDRALSGVEILYLSSESPRLGSKASRPDPANGALNVDPDAVLSWVPGEGAISHDVYFGTDYTDINDADTTSAEFMDNIDVNSFDPYGLEEATMYYWRIDEVNGPNTVKGDVWSFTTRPPLGSNLLAWWKLDEGDGLTAFDSVGNNDGTLINGPAWTDSGINGSLEFDGIDDHVSVPYDDSFQLPVFTVSAWIYLGRDPRPQGSGMIVGRGEDPVSDEEALLFVVGPEGSQWGEGLKIGYEDSSDREHYFGTSYFPSVASWTHVAATRGSDGLVCVYANGILLDSWHSTAVPSPDCYQDLTIGSNWGNPPSGPQMGNFFEGMIDDVRIYDRALSPNDIADLCSSASLANYYNVDGVDGNDLNDGLTPETAFATIQKGIDTASDGDTVLVFPDTYVEELDFNGKPITVTGVDEPAVLSAPDFYAVTFIHSEGSDSVLKNFIVKDSYAAFLCMFASPTISNVTVVDCNNGVIADEGADPLISNSIFWNNSGADLAGCEAIYSFVEDDSYGSPLFVDPNNGDYHLKSEGWRWASSGGWTRDSVTSPCVDYGNPGTPLGNEPLTLPVDPCNTWGQNLRINMGAYGRTSQASMAPIGWAQIADSNDDGAQGLAPPAWALTADLNNDGIVNVLDAGLGSEYWLGNGDEMPWDLNRDGRVDLADYALLGSDFGEATSWRK
jgi:hypothetical protein